MEEKMWVISKKGDKNSSLIWPAEITVVSVILYLYLTGPSFFDLIDICFYTSAIAIYLILVFI